MRSALHILGAVGIAALSLATSVKTSEAQVIYPWCAHYIGRDMGGAANCGFVTLAQCQATVSGNGGWCGINPWYEPPPQRPRRRAQG